MAILAVTGTGTGAGKTLVTAALAALARARGASCAVVKPAQTGVDDGEPGDLAAVRALSGVDDLHELVRYAELLSPAAAARRSGRPPLDLAQCCALVLDLARSRDLVLVEGTGGLLVRFDDDGLTLADVARALAVPVLVVAGAGPDTVNTTALTLEALATRGLQLAGIVVGAWPAEPGEPERAMLRDLETLAARPLLGVLPTGAGQLSPQAFLDAARAGLGPQLGGGFDSRAFRALHPG